MKAILTGGTSIECADVKEANHGVRLYDREGGLAGYVPYGSLDHVARRRTLVSSTSIRSIGYDNEEAILELEFHSGGVYEYHEVPREVYEGLLGADSRGQYFHDHVRGEFDYVRVA